MSTATAAPNATAAQNATVAIKELLEAGVHFGHQTKRWNPKMKEYIFGERNGIYIVDLQKTLVLLPGGARLRRRTSRRRASTVMFVGTKRQAQEAVAEEAHRCGMPYVTERWLGGLLTNFVTIRKSLDRLKELDANARGDGRQTSASPRRKWPASSKERTQARQEPRRHQGMKNLPDAVFVIDTRKEAIAVQEARKLKIPVIGVVDTNCDPDEVDFVIPGNDDALRAIQLFTGRIADADHGRPRHPRVARQRSCRRRAPLPPQATRLPRRAAPCRSRPGGCRKRERRSADDRSVKTASAPATQNRFRNSRGKTMSNHCRDGAQACARKPARA